MQHNISFTWWHIIRASNRFKCINGFITFTQFNSIKLNQNIIKQYDIQNHNDKFLSYENINEFKSNGKSLTHSKNKQSKQLPKEESEHDDNFEMFEGTEDEQEKALNMMYKKKFKEITKLQKLKGEILMMEQKKKYALNKNAKRLSNIKIVIF